jgi:hypothetical protein
LLRGIAGVDSVGDLLGWDVNASGGEVREASGGRCGGVEVMRRSPMKRAMKPMRQVGKRGAEWASERAALKARCEKLGITTCRLRFAGCTPDNNLGFAHAVKRRKLSKHAEVGSAFHVGTAILACNGCHDRLERMSPEMMLEMVMRLF